MIYHLSSSIWYIVRLYNISPLHLSPGFLYIWQSGARINTWAPGCMMTSSNGNIFRVTGHLRGEFTGEFPAQRPVTRSFDVFFDLRLNKRLSKQSCGWWSETLSHRLYRHGNVISYVQNQIRLKISIIPEVFKMFILQAFSEINQ